jgi:hypothetical protein
MTAPHRNASSVLAGYYSSAAQAYERWWASALCAQHIGGTGRRLAALEPVAQADFLRQVRARLEHLKDEDFADRSEVIAATATAPQ